MTTFSGLPPKVRTLWAKSGEIAGHGLLAHMLDVAAAAEVLLQFEPEASTHWAADQLGLPRADAGRWIAFLAGLHDFGKAIPSFQGKWPTGAQADQQVGLDCGASSRSVVQHSCATAALLEGALAGLLPATAGTWLHATIGAIAAHHGYHWLPTEIVNGRPRRESAAWADARQGLLQVYIGILAPIGSPTAGGVSLALVNWLAGLTSAADWIASNPSWFPLGERQDDLEEYVAQSRRLAQDALHQIGWDKFHVLLPEDDTLTALLQRMTGRNDIVPRPLQRVGDQLLQAARGPALLLVEAPMGEGKTELAFLALLRWQRQNAHRGLYVALPTQATGNAMFGRALSFLDAFVQAHADVQLVHGGAVMNERFQGLRAVDAARLQGVDESPVESLSASAWFGQRRRPLLSPYGVGTVDQALLAVLNVKHHFVRLWGLANRVIVLDEIHAYDTYTSGLIAVLLQWLRALGSSVVLMSATLPKQRRLEFIRAWGEDPVNQEAMPDYPRITLIDRNGTVSCHVSAQRVDVADGATSIDPGAIDETAAARRSSMRLQLSCVDEDPAAMVDCAVDQLDGGGCGAIILNTVDRAQVAYRLLESRVGADVSLMLFHARFPADQRALIEEQVMSRFGPEGQRPRRALLVATQVVEQSLDLDFDFMLSDLAPVDLLLQRAGRLHRHERQRPARHQESARLWVAGLRPHGSPEIKETAWAYVYDPYILMRTWGMLKDQSMLELPSDIDRWVQAVYDFSIELPEEIASEIREQIEVSGLGEHLGKIQRERQLAQDIALNPSDDPAWAYADKPRGHEEGDGIGLVNQTRLGRESVTLVPVYAVASGWSIYEGGTAFVADQKLDDVLAKALYARQIKVSNRTVVSHYKSQERPACLADHPWLRDSHLLPLVNGCCVLDRLTITLDEKLGLVFCTSPEQPH